MLINFLELTRLGINQKKDDLNFQNYTFVVGQDIDFTAGLMCYIQLSLLGVAGYVKIGNTLTDPIIHGDNLENYWFTPIYFSNIWSMRRLFNVYERIMKND